MTQYKVENTIIGELYEIQSIDYNYGRFVSESGDFPISHMTDLGSLFNDSYYMLRNLTPGLRSHYERAKLGPIVMQPLTVEERNARRGDYHSLVKLNYSTTVEGVGESIPLDTSMRILTIDHRFLNIPNQKWSVAGVFNALATLGVYNAGVSIADILEGDQERINELLSAYVVSTYCDRTYDFDFVLYMVTKLKQVLDLVAAHFPEGLATPNRPVGIRHMLEGGRLSMIVAY